MKTRSPDEVKRACSDTEDSSAAGGGTSTRKKLVASNDALAEATIETKTTTDIKSVALGKSTVDMTNAV